MPMSEQEWRAVQSKQHLKRGTKSGSPLEYLFALVMLTGISILVMGLYSVVDAYKHLPDRLNINAPQRER
jgi:hypothetical protein